MKAKKIIKAIAKLAAVTGVTFIAYKVGEMNGESRERIRQKYDDEDDYDDDMYEVTCPNCGNTITVDFDVIQSGEIPCPNCGENLEFDLSCLEDEECDCGCHHD